MHDYTMAKSDGKKVMGKKQWEKAMAKLNIQTIINNTKYHCQGSTTD